MADYNFRDGVRQRWVKDYWCFFFTMGLEVLQKKKKKRLPQLEPQTLIFRTSVQTSHFLDECAIYHAMLKLRAFLLLKGISCYSGVMVAHSSRK